MSQRFFHSSIQTLTLANKLIFNQQHDNCCHLYVEDDFIHCSSLIHLIHIYDKKKKKINVVHRDIRHNKRRQGKYICNLSNIYTTNLYTTLNSITLNTHRYISVLSI